MFPTSEVIHSLNLLGGSDRLLGMARNEVQVALGGLDAPVSQERLHGVDVHAVD